MKIDKWEGFNLTYDQRYKFVKRLNSAENLADRNWSNLGEQIEKQIYVGARDGNEILSVNIFILADLLEKLDFTIANCI